MNKPDTILRRVRRYPDGGISAGKKKGFAIIATKGEEKRQEIFSNWASNRIAAVALARAAEPGREPKAEPEPGEEGDVSRILCPFCSAPWTADMVKVYAEAELEDGYYGDSHVEHIDTTIDVTCSSCKRLIYRKECRV